MAKQSKSSSGLRQKVIENVKSMAWALFLVLVIRSSIVEAFKIPSGSMIPTLMVGDHIFVNKFAYGLKVPFWDWFADQPLFLVKRAAPQRGDVVVFKFPKDESVHYIKRVVGVPGDQIEVRDKVLYINGKALDRKEALRPEVIASLEGHEYDLEALQLFDEINPTTKLPHLTMIDRNNPHFAEFGPVTVPAEHLFVMGDNRDYSSDSRVWGFVPFKNIRGKALFIWFSLWIDFGKDQYYFHPGRIGGLVR